MKPSVTVLTPGQAKRTRPGTGIKHPAKTKASRQRRQATRTTRDCVKTHNDRPERLNADNHRPNASANSLTPARKLALARPPSPLLTVT